jgi:molybdenum cofactor guanylyltransferase
MDERDGARIPPAPLVAVLAGGLGSRMGTSKPSAELAGRPLVSYPLAAAAQAGLQAVVVAKRDSELPALGAPVVLEPDVPRHPLCGVLAALRHAEGLAPPGAQSAGEARGVLTVGCDMPFLSGALLAWIAQLGQAAAAKLDGRMQPLPALYPPGAAPAVMRALRKGDSLRATLELLGAREIAEHELRRFGDPRRMLFSVDDARDLRAAETWAAEQRFRAAGGPAARGPSFE